MRVYFVVLVALMIGCSATHIARDDAMEMVGKNFNDVKREHGIPTDYKKNEDGTAIAKYLKKLPGNRTREYHLIEFEIAANGIVTAWGLHPITSMDVVDQLDRQKVGTIQK